eukprot:scaffold17780_cov29-Tisochrysis_lutea.AAC.4
MTSGAKVRRSTCWSIAASRRTTSALATAVLALPVSASPLLPSSAGCAASGGARLPSSNSMSTSMPKSMSSASTSCNSFSAILSKTHWRSTTHSHALLRPLGEHPGCHALPPRRLQHDDLGLEAPTSGIARGAPQCGASSSSFERHPLPTASRHPALASKHRPENHSAARMIWDSHMKPIRQAKRRQLDGRAFLSSAADSRGEPQRLAPFSHQESAEATRQGRASLQMANPVLCNW